MPKSWTSDSALLESVAQNLCEAVVLLPKQLLRVDAVTREIGIPFSHVQILVMLQKGDVTIGDIAKTLGIAKPNITPLLDSLVTKGYVERVRGSGDKRIVSVRMTAKGQEKLDELHNAIGKQIADWDNYCNRSDVKQLNNALAYLIQIAERGINV